MPKIKVLIADDQELFASGIEIILRGYGQGEVVPLGIAKNGKEAVSMTESLRPDVVLLDVRMPEMDGVEAAKVIHERHPEIRILILTTFDDDQYVLEALTNGALGYVLKNIPPDELIMAIKAVYRGSLLVSPTVGRKLVQQAKTAAELSAERAAMKSRDLESLASSFGDRLTPRELEILSLLLEDYDNLEIAQALSIAEQTVKNHVSLIYSKLGAGDRNHARKIARRIIAGLEQRIT